MNAGAVLVTGGLAVGKTAVGIELGELLEQSAAAGAVVDLDWLCWAWAEQLDANGIQSLLCENLRVTVPHFLRRGCRHVVLCRTVLTAADVEGIKAAIGDLDLRTIRLTVARTEAEARIRSRDNAAEALRHLEDLDAFDRAVSTAVPDAPVVDTTGRHAQEVAAEVLRVIDWPLSEEIDAVLEFAEPCPLKCQDHGVGIRHVLRPRRQPVAEVQPDPLRTPEDAMETGFLIGATGNQGTPWIGIAIKNLKDRRIATGRASARAVRRAGKAAGKQSGHPPSEG